jgi:predicted O-methyltransferase YrrM
MPFTNTMIAAILLLATPCHVVSTGNVLYYYESGDKKFNVGVLPDETYPLVEFQLPFSHLEDHKKSISFNCQSPCEVGSRAYTYCANDLKLVGHSCFVCAANIWLFHATKEHLIVNRDFGKVLNFGGMLRTNHWFETNTEYLPYILFKSFLSFLPNDFLTSAPLHVLEVGSYEGGSTVWFLRYLLSHPHSTITCLDNWSLDDGSSVFSRFLHNIQATGSEHKVNIMKGDSVESFAKLIVDGKNQYYDFAYVDGSHFVTDALLDIGLAWRLLKARGLLIIDDVNWQEFESSNEDMSCAVFSGLSEVNNTGTLAMAPAVMGYLSSLPGGVEVLHCGHQIVVRKIV